MTIIAAYRLTHDQIRQIVADHVNDKFDINIPAEKVSLYSDSDDRTCCKVAASADVSDYAKVIAADQ